MPRNAQRTSLRWVSLTVLAGALVSVIIPVQQFLHSAAGGHGREHIDPIVHALRDGAAVLPGMLLATWVASRICAAIIGDARLTAQLRATRTFVPVMPLAVGVTIGVGVPLHAWLFEARDAMRGSGVTDWLQHMRRDGAIAVAIALPTTAATSVIARLSGDAWHRVTRTGATPKRVLLGGVGCIASLAVAVVVLTSVTGTATADLAEPPCPAGAPVKNFEISAIDVEITLNRFGDRDPQGRMYVLRERIGDVRQAEDARTVSVGLGDDPIQPLVVRANMGDCIVVDYRNDADEAYGFHVDGLRFIADAPTTMDEGDAQSVPPGASRQYRFYVAEEPALEGAHHIRPGLGRRQAVSHGLFGAVVVEPKGATYDNPRTGEPQRSGWDAIIKVPGRPDFREFSRLYHEIGDEDFEVLDAKGEPLPEVDPITETYRPGSRAINYRAEPSMHRLERNEHQKPLAYNSYTFGDPATPVMRSYVGEPTKIRLLHAGSEMFHVFHLHGGGIRWRANPLADPTWDYGDVGLDKRPPAQSQSERIDSQSIGPGESFNVEVEGGAGGVQQTVGDLLEHCHIAEHYSSGMWSFWRVFNTRQPDLVPLPDRAAPPASVDSTQLLGRTMPDGTRLTAANIDRWISAMLPPRGKPSSDQDATVWDWQLDRSNAARPLALGEPEETEEWPNLRDGTHPGGLPGDEFVDDRPKLRFHPTDGRPAFPLLRTNIGKRAPFSPRHSGTPFLGARVNAPRTGSADPYARRPDGLCPANAPTRNFDISAITVPARVTRAGSTDQTAMIFARNQDKAAIRAGTRAVEPLAIRANVGDCVAVDFTSEMNDATSFGGFAKSNIHIHHLQFDIQGSDGASAGYVFDQSVRPYREAGVQLSARAGARTTTLTAASPPAFKPGTWIGIGLGAVGIEVRQVASVSGHTVRLTEGIFTSRPIGTWVGAEFAKYQWYPDVNLDNIFWHDHVDGIHGWPKGLVGQLVVEPPGSTYHDPVTGQRVESGSIVDIRTSSPLIPGKVDGSFREVALWNIEDNPAAEDTFNLRAEPWVDRLLVDPDQSLVFSSWRHGDPFTPLPRAYPGDPVVFRTVDVGGNGLASFRIDGHAMAREPRHRSSAGQFDSGTTDTIRLGISERLTSVLEGGAGGVARHPGDYLYMNGIGRRIQDGAWGIFRVLANRTSTLQPLPGRPAPPTGPATPASTGQRPPAPITPGNPCPTGAPVRSFDVSAVDLSGRAPRGPGIRAAFIPTATIEAVRRNNVAEPLVLHVSEGDCLEVTLRNQRDVPQGGGPVPRASFHVSELRRAAQSSGVNVGYGPEQTVAGGQQRTYRMFADSERIEGALITDLSRPKALLEGLYGMVVVSPRESDFRDPVSGTAKSIGSQVIVDPPGQPSYRDMSLIMFDDDDKIGLNEMPYPTEVSGNPSVNYSIAGARPDTPDMLRTGPHGPGTPLLQANIGDPVRVHVAVAAGSEQDHVFGMSSIGWPSDPFLGGSNRVSAIGLAAWETRDVHFIAGADSGAGAVHWGDMRLPFTEAGMWGLFQVHGTCSTTFIQIPGSSCPEAAIEPEPDPE